MQLANEAMSDSSPRQNVKARRKQKLEDDSEARRRKVEIALMQNKRLSDISSSNSFKSTNSRSVNDIENILDPTFDTFDSIEQQPSAVTINYSADSIIRRVEAEIAAARKAACGIQSPVHDDEEDDDDMAQILNTSTFQSIQHSFSGDSSKSRALELIRDEFQEDVERASVEFVSDGNVAASSSHLYFTDEEWQVSGECPFNEKGTVKEEKKEEKRMRMRSYQFGTPASPIDSLNLQASIRNSELNEPEDLKQIPTRRMGNELKGQKYLGRRLENSDLKEKDDLIQTQVQSRESIDLQGNKDLTQTLALKLENCLLKVSEDSKHALAFKTENEDCKRTVHDGENPMYRENPEITDTPTRSNGRSKSKQEKYSSPLRGTPQDLQQPSPALNKDPEGDYKATHTPPRRSLVRDAARPKANIVKEEGTEQHPISLTRTSPAMSRTRELLDSLKKQRESIVRSPANRNSPMTLRLDDSVSKLSSACLRSPNQQLYYTRATRAKERIKSSPRGRPSDKAESALSTEREVVLAAEPARAQTSITMDSTVQEQQSHDPQKQTSEKQLLHQHQPKRAPFPEDSSDNIPKRNDRRAEVQGDSVSKQSRRIRFRNPFPVLIPPAVRRDLAAIIKDHAMGVPDVPIRWVKPKQELKQLIVAAMGTSLPRRSNACGALKVLTRHEKNQLSLVRTDGFLSALIFAASQSILDVDTDLAIDARTRAVSCLKNVCGPKDNRILVFNHPGVMECLVKVAKLDAGEGRAMAAAAIAMLAKTPSCREGLIQVEGLVDTLAKVMQSTPAIVSEEKVAHRTTMSPQSKNLDDSVSESSYRTGKDHDDVSIHSDSSSVSSSYEPQSVASSRHDVKAVDSIRYQTEERLEEFINQARSNACAALLHMSKHCTVTVCAL